MAKSVWKPGSNLTKCKFFLIFFFISQCFQWYLNELSESISVMFWWCFVCFFIVCSAAFVEQHLSVQLVKTRITAKKVMCYFYERKTDCFHKYFLIFLHLQQYLNISNVFTNIFNVIEIKMISEFMVCSFAA